MEGNLLRANQYLDLAKSCRFFRYTRSLTGLFLSFADFNAVLPAIRITPLYTKYQDTLTAMNVITVLTFSLQTQ